MQALIEIQKDIAGLSVKTDRLIRDVDKVEGDVTRLGGKVTWAQGFGICAAILIPICAAAIWFFVGGDIRALRDQVSTQQVEQTLSPRAIRGASHPGVANPPPPHD
jgi:hypothetical protein